MLPTPPAAGGSAGDLQPSLAAVALAESIRRYGHLAARLDPIGFHAPVGDPSLHPQAHGLTTDVLRRLPATIVGGPVVQGAANAYEAIERLRAIYCATSGHDFAHVFVPDERVWLRESVEARRFRPPVDPIEGRELLDRVTQVEVFERFLHRTFPGKTRFSIEGLDLMVPILDEIIADAAASGVRHVLIAMAHRGRLNVLAHVMQKPYAQILAEFKDPLFARSGRIELGWMGDVKYHAGARLVRADVPSSLVISMPPNPSHLEAVDPVLVGMARASATTGRRAGRAAAAQPRGARHPHPRRRGVPRPGRRRRDAQPVAAHRLGRRRHHPPHRQQPARLHRRSARGVLDQLRQRTGPRLQGADRPRQRRRRRGVHRGGAAGLGLPRALRARLPDRPGRLPPLRPQRGRRAGVHPAAAVPEGGAAPDRPAAVRRVAGGQRPGAVVTARRTGGQARRRASRRPTPS